MQLNHDRLSKHPHTLRRRWGPMLGRLTKTTHFDWEELESLCFVFHKLTRGTKGKMTRQQFVDVMHNSLDLTNAENADYAYKAYDINNNNYIGIEDWCRGMSVVLRGTLDEKINYAFQTYDRFNEKFLNRKNLWMVTESWNAALDTESHIRELLETVMTSMASDMDKGVSARDFRKAVEKYPLLMQFLGEAFPERSAIITFLNTMMPRARYYEYSPEFCMEREKSKPFLAYGAPSSTAAVTRLGGFTAARATSSMLPQINPSRSGPILSRQ